MFLVSSCCCCWSLEKGTLFAGIYTCIVAFLCLGAGILLIVGFSEDEQLQINVKNEDVSHDSNADIYFVTGILYVIVSLIWLLLSILLFFGIKWHKRQLFIPWMIFVVFSFVLYIPAIILSKIIEKEGVPRITSRAVPIIVLVYLLVVVHSYYKSDPFAQATQV